MEKAYLSLVKHALKKGHSVSVGWHGDIDLKKSRKFTEIKKYIRIVGDCHLRFYDKSGKHVGTALVIPDLAPDETVSDFTSAKTRGGKNWIDKWFSAYFKQAY